MDWKEKQQFLNDVQQLQISAMNLPYSDVEDKSGDEVNKMYIERVEPLLRSVRQERLDANKSL